MLAIAALAVPPQARAQENACKDPNELLVCVTKAIGVGPDKVVTKVSAADDDAFYKGVNCDPTKPTPPSPDPNEGLVEEKSSDERCPSGTAYIEKKNGDKDESFCIDKYHAELVEVVDGGGEKPWSPYFAPPKAPRKVRAVSLRGAIPQSNISMVDAKAACENSHKQLCTDSEWLRACAGPKGDRKFPYADSPGKRVPGRCNDQPRVPSPLDEAYGKINPKPDGGEFGPFMRNACILQRPRSLTRTGALKDCVTPEGVFDMIGNLHQWTSGKVFRGGYFQDQKLNGEGCTYVTTRHAPEHNDYSTGFRCCAKPRSATTTAGKGTIAPEK